MEITAPDSAGRLIVPPELSGHRLDTVLAKLAPQHSRARWQALIDQGRVRVNGRPALRTRQKTFAGDSIEWQEPEPRPTELIPEAKPLNVLFEDRHLIVLDKPPGLVIHPAPGHESGTLVHALLHHCPDLRGVGGELRPGIVHRLDRDTSGVLVVAKDERSHRSLAEQFRSRQVQKEYLALVHGQPEPPSGTIETLIGRNPSRRDKMSAKVIHGRLARTHYQTLATSELASLLRVQIETGRTHQIRVHMAHIGHPVIGDPLYGPKSAINKKLGAVRQMLHAWRIRFLHPCSLEPMEFECPIPSDFKATTKSSGITYLL
ncbi:MAG: RluA family pseudouridine synthase [Kiritimatiellae bacterium]|nr:RluA family pseudouridine synthase [Kiritimatiellia bacterium]